MTAMGAAAAAAVGTFGALHPRPALAQCPSCSNPGFFAGRAALDDGRMRSGELRVGFDAAYLRADGLIEGSSTTRLTQSLERSTDTLYQHRLVRLVLWYGVTERLSVGIVAPYENREMLNRRFPPEGHAGVRRHLNLRGPGDAELTARLALGRGGSRWGLGVLTGTVIPIGETHAATTRSEFETVLQIGAGTFIPILGGDARVELGPRGFAGGRVQVRPSLYANGDGFRRGSAALAAASAGFRVGDGAVTAAAGMELGVRAADQRGGIDVRNTGGRTLYSTATLALAATSNVTASLTLRIPVHQNVNGLQLRESATLVAGAIYRR